MPNAVTIKLLLGYIEGYLFQKAGKQGVNVTI